jgi:hypothetical protein
MKRTYNLSCSLLLDIAAYAFVNANNTDVIATSPITEEQTQSTPNRHTITLVLSQLSDLKVEEGTRINVGDIISDRTTERTKLYAKRLSEGVSFRNPLEQAKRQRLADSLAKARLPLNALKPLSSI